MLLLTIIYYITDIKEYGKEFVEENCSFAERIGRWFLMFGWLEINIFYYILYKL